MIVCEGVFVCKFVLVKRCMMGIWKDFTGRSVTNVRDQTKTLVVRMHCIIHSGMKYLINAGYISMY